MSSEELKKYSPTDPELIDKIVNNLKSKGIFDQFRKDCLADVDTKPAYQNLQQRVNGTVTGFLATQKWQHGLNKTQLRESLRRHTVQQAFLEVGVDRIVDQVVNPKVYSVFTPKVEDVVCELLGLEKPKPKPLLLNFQKFKKSLEALPPAQPAPAPAAPSPEPIKEEPEEIEKIEETTLIEPSPPDEKPPEPPQSSPPPTQEDPDEVPKEEPMSPAGSVAEVVNNDDDSNTIDEMPLLAASLDSDSNRGGSPAMDGAPQNCNTKVGAMSDMSDSNSLLSTRPPLEYDSSTNNLSSLKSEEKTSPSKKFDNFSNLGEKLKQADVNLRETSLNKKEVIEESDVTKSSENDTESLEMKLEPLSESNMSSTDAFRNEPTKVDGINEKIFSEDSQSSPLSFKNKTRITESRDERSRSHKHEKKSHRDSSSAKPDKKDESMDGSKETVKKEQNKESSSSKHESKSRSKEDHRSKSSNDKDKHRSHKDRSHSSDKHGKSDSSKDKKDKRDRSENDGEKRIDNPKVSDSSKHSEKKKKEDDKSKHSKDSKGHKKVDDHKNSNKDKIKTSDKEKNADDQKKSENYKSKKDSSGKSSRTKSDDTKHKDDKKKDDDDDKKKSPRKRKSGRCDEDEVKSKNSRRSSDRDSNGNAGGGSSKSKSTNSSSHNGKKSSKSDKGRSHTKSKEQSDVMEEDCDFDEADEVDKILMEINNSIQNENQRLNISEVLNEPTVKKPKIARNFHEIKKIMQARKDIDRQMTNDLKTSVEDKASSDVESSCNESFEEDFTSTEPHQDVSEIVDDSGERSGELSSPPSNEIVMKGCSIVVTDVLRGQLKESSLSLENKCIILEDGAIQDISNPPPENVSCSGNPMDSSRDSDSSCDLISSVMAVEVETAEKFLSENIHSRVGSKDSSVLTSEKTKTSPVDVNEMGDSKSELLSPHEDELKNVASLRIAEERARPSCSSDILPIDDKLDSDVCIKTESIDTDKENSADQSVIAPVPSRSKRSNAGTLMYAILESSKPPVVANRSSKKRGTKLETTQNFDICEAEVQNPSVNSVDSQTSENQDSSVEAATKTCSTDDGSDVSNKENDETNVSCKTRSQIMDDEREMKNVETRTTRRKDVGPNEVNLVETRTTRRRNHDLSEDLNKSVTNNNVTRGRFDDVKLKCKNNRDEPKCFGEEIPGKVGIDVENKRRSTSNRHCSRKGVTALYVRNAELDRVPCVNTSKDSCAVNSLIDDPKFCEETSLHMDKENMTVGNSTPVEQRLISSSQRRVSCQDSFETSQIPYTEKVSSSIQPEDSITMNSDKDPLQDDSHVNESLGDSRLNERSNRRSKRRHGSSVKQDSSPIFRRNVRKVSETELPSMKLVSASADLVNSSAQSLAIPDLHLPSTITINVDSSDIKVEEDEPPLVTLFFEGSAIATFDSNDLPLKDPADCGLSVESAGPSCSPVDKSKKGVLHRSRSSPEDSCSSEFKGFSQPAQDLPEYKGFTDVEIQEATVKLHLLKQFIANKVQPPLPDNRLDQIDPPRAKKTRVSSEGANSTVSKSTDSTTRRNPRQRNFSLNSSPEKDKKEVLGGQCKAESKDSGLCESPEQASFVLDMYQNDAVMESGDNTVRTRKMANNVPPTSTPGFTRNPRNDRSTDSRTKKQHEKNKNPQRYSTVDLYKPRPVVGTRSSKSTPTTSSGRPKRYT
ncbi:hypothetical protein GE061_015152 [Apolygus lucorum]|uniref:BOD1/SHG1 domain-containing protein n=1 Tax=Apolygus lucorum TaxID=248454 RepID=A0A8S9XP87_APOLU|nr:hypothetical protein GE061_015152 [Apolygus lucorum]